MTFAHKAYAHELARLAPGIRSMLKKRRETLANARHARRLPLKPGKADTITHDYVRNGTTTLFAALNTLDGTVIGRCMQRHRHQLLFPEGCPRLSGHSSVNSAVASRI